MKILIKKLLLSAIFALCLPVYTGRPCLSKNGHRLLNNFSRAATVLGSVFGMLFLYKSQAIKDHLKDLALTPEEVLFKDQFLASEDATKYILDHAIDTEAEFMVDGLQFVTGPYERFSAVDCTIYLPNNFDEHSKVDQAIVLHELGHCAGKHSSEQGAFYRNYGIALMAPILGIIHAPKIAAASTVGALVKSMADYFFLERRQERDADDFMVSFASPEQLSAMYAYHVSLEKKERKRFQEAYSGTFIDFFSESDFAYETIHYFTDTHETSAQRAERIFAGSIRNIVPEVKAHRKVVNTEF